MEKKNKMTKLTYLHKFDIIIMFKNLNKGVNLMATREIHSSLRGGTGIVVTHTTKVCGLTFVRLDLRAESTIGEHLHTSDSEIYFTFSRHIRFCNNQKWKLWNLCSKGSAHSAANLSKNKIARIWAVKF